MKKKIWTPKIWCRWNSKVFATLHFILIQVNDIIQKLVLLFDQNLPKWNWSFVKSTKLNKMNRYKMKSFYHFRSIPWNSVCSCRISFKLVNSYCLLYNFTGYKKMSNFFISDLLKYRGKEILGEKIDRELISFIIIKEQEQNGAPSLTRHQHLSQV